MVLLVCLAAAGGTATSRKNPVGPNKKNPPPESSGGFFWKIEIVSSESFHPTAGGSGHDPSATNVRDSLLRHGSRSDLARTFKDGGTEIHWTRCLYPFRPKPSSATDLRLAISRRNVGFVLAKMSGKCHASAIAALQAGPPRGNPEGEGHFCISECSFPRSPTPLICGCLPGCAGRVSCPRPWVRGTCSSASATNLHRAAAEPMTRKHCAG